MKSQTVRSDRKWIKITKPSKGRFRFSIGYNSDTKEYTHQIWPVTMVPTWERAIDLAIIKLND